MIKAVELLNHLESQDDVEMCLWRAVQPGILRGRAIQPCTHLPSMTSREHALFPPAFTFLSICFPKCFSYIFNLVLMFHETHRELKDTHGSVRQSLITLPVLTPSLPPKNVYNISSWSFHFRHYLFTSHSLSLPPSSHSPMSLLHLPTFPSELQSYSIILVATILTLTL